MKLARKLTLALVLGILVVLAGNAAFRVSRELALFESDSRRDSLLLGRMLAGSVSRLWPTTGEAQALDLVDDANQRESDVRIRWTWLDLEPGATDAPEVALAPSGPPFPLEAVAQIASGYGGALYTTTSLRSGPSGTSGPASPTSSPRPTARGAVTSG